MAKKRNNIGDEYIKKLVKIAQQPNSEEQREKAILEILDLFEPLRYRLANNYADETIQFDDVFQHVTLKIIEAILDYDETKSNSPIQHISARAKNGAWNYYKKEKKYFRENRKEVSVEYIAATTSGGDDMDSELEADVMYFLDTSDFDISEDIIHKILLDESFGELTDKQREVIKKIFFEDMTQREVADILNINQSSVSRVTKRGVERLRSKLNEEISKESPTSK